LVSVFFQFYGPDLKALATYQDSPLARDNPKTLKQAREFPDWPKWEEAIQTELDQLAQMHTWRLMEKPSDAVPISNKWVLTKKYNKAGELVKYKARLILQLWDVHKDPDKITMRPFHQ
jgi:Reverse transcriptase (RNA-dependent DNA polymerase)